MGKIRMITIVVVFSLCFFLLFSYIFDMDSEDLGGGFVYNSEQRHILGKIDIPPSIVSFD